MMRHGIERSEAVGGFLSESRPAVRASGFRIAEPLPSVKPSLGVIGSNGIEIVEASDVGRGCLTA
jgi:hypothetical protein